MTGRELAEEFTDIWKGLDVGDINKMLAMNVSMDLLEFFAGYAEEFASDCDQRSDDPEELRRRLPNLLVIGYLIRVLEERLG